jgi:hypothetical protein
MEMTIVLNVVILSVAKDPRISSLPSPVFSANGRNPRTSAVG